MNKTELRSRYHKKRRDLDLHTVEIKSKAIAENFLKTFDLSSLGFIHTYIPIVKEKEVDTSFIVQAVQKNNDNIQFITPYIKNDFELGHEVYGGNRLFETPDKIDIVLVPLIAFDRVGNRIGFGKGYYDRFLVTLSPSVLKIGLGYDLSLVQSGIPVDTHDVRLDYVITESMVWDFASK